MTEEFNSQLRYLLLFEGNSSSIVRLPNNGEQIIGRGSDAHIQLNDVAISRHHARLVSKNGEAWLIDLKSHNGTRLNGELLSTPRPLLSGDQLQIGKATLIYHSDAPTHTHERCVPFSEFSQRCTKEFGRVLPLQEPLALAVVSLGANPERALIEKLLLRQLPAGFLCWDSDEQLLLMIPNATDAPSDCAGLLSVALTVAPEARLGFSVTPTDGCALGSLLSGARAAVQVAAPGTSCAATQTFRTLSIGEKNAFIADPAMLRMYELLARLAVTSLPILITGETGTGKELAAQAIHQLSPRHDKPMIELNCAAIHENLLEGEFFGYQRGAFTGATNAKQGLLEVVSGGTLFLDEISELSLTIQAKLLRVLETRKLTRLGEVQPREVSFRLVAASNRDLEAETRAGRFRQDLFFRLKGAILCLPPLRDRPREIQLLARTFLAEACAQEGRAIMELSGRSIQCLAEHTWPGNVRELKHVMAYIVAAVEENIVEPHHFLSQLSSTQRDVVEESRPIALQSGNKESTSLPDALRPLADEMREIEKTRIIAALQTTYYNQTQAAKLLQMPRRTFLERMKLYEITKPKNV